MAKTKIPRLEKVCYCLPLRGGVITLVYFNLLVSGAAFMAYLYVDFVKLFIKFFSGRLIAALHETRAKLHLNMVVPLVFVFGLAELVMTVVALIALHREKLKLLEAYLYYSTIVTVFIVCFRILDTFFIIWQFDLIITAVFLLFKLYYIVSIRSLVKKRRELMQDTMEMADDV